jgi:hypothetical protein
VSSLAEAGKPFEGKEAGVFCIDRGLIDYLERSFYYAIVIGYPVETSLAMWMDNSVTGNPPNEEVTLDADELLAVEQGRAAFRELASALRFIFKPSDPENLLEAATKDFAQPSDQMDFTASGNIAYWFPSIFRWDMNSAITRTRAKTKTSARRFHGSPTSYPRITPPTPTSRVKAVYGHSFSSRLSRERWRLSLRQSMRCIFSLGGAARRMKTPCHPLENSIRSTHTEEPRI